MKCIKCIEMKNDIAVIIVLFNPDVFRIKQIVFRVNDVCHLILVDNSSNDNGHIWGECCQYISLLSNKGIAIAQNIGIAKAKELGCKHIVFFDQDSSFDNHYVNQIVEQYKVIENNKINIFLLGPTVFNEKTKKEYKSAFHKYSTDINGFQQRREIISSGSCVAISKIAKVGGLDDELFIDTVDFEWCWRAMHYGYINGITTNVSLNHNVGQREINIFRHKVIISSPFRYYYQYRNFIRLCSRKYVPFSWKRNVGIKYFLRIFYFPFVLKDGIKIVKFMIKGLFAGLKKDRSLYSKL